MPRRGLIKIDNLKLSILDEETLRGILVLRKDALKGLLVEGFEVNNLISSMLQDYSYLLKGIFNDENNNAIILKLPLEIENEFENKYNVSDLLIGHLSVIGVYKGIVTKDFINKNTFTFFTNIGTQQAPERQVFPSSIEQSDSNSEDNSESYEETTKFHFIDTIALIQDVQFEQHATENIEKETTKEGIWERFLNFLHKLGGK